MVLHQLLQWLLGRKAAVALIVVPAALVGWLADVAPVAERLGLAGATGLAAALSLASLRSWSLSALWLVAGLGAATQVRLGATDGWRAALVVLAAGVALAAASWAVARLRLSRVEPGPMVGAVVMLAALVLRVLPAMVPRGKVSNGLLPTPLGSIQVGEFSRIVLLVGFGLLIGGLRGGWVGSRGQWLAVGGASASLFLHLLLLASRDTGPAVLAVVGCLAVWSAGRRESAARGRKVFALSSVVGVAAALLGLWLTGVTILAPAVARAEARLSEMWQPGFQMVVAKAAVTDGGAIGSGLGSSELARWIPVAGSDFVMAVLAADLGVLVGGALAVAVLFAYGRFLGLIDLDTRFAGIPAGLLFVAVAQEAWGTLGALGIAPMTGISAPWLVGTGSALVSTALGLGIALGFADATSALPHRGGRLASVTRAAQLTVVVACLVVALMPWPRGTLPSFRPAGDLKSRDAVVLATTNASGRTYPEGDVFAAVTGRLWPRQGALGAERGLAAQLTCGGAYEWWEQAEGLLHPLPCRRADVVTTIDSTWQRAVATALDGQRGAAVIVDSFTGEVLAQYSSELGDPSTWEVRNDFQSLATTRTSAPGSILKPLVAAVALGAGVEPTGAPADRLLIDGESLGNAGGRPCADTTLGGAIEQSCNTVFGYLAGRLGATALKKGLEDYFGADSGLRFDGGGAVGLTTGLTDATTPAQLARTGVGQESVQATPIAMASSYSALVAAAAGRPSQVTHVRAGSCQSGFHADVAAASTLVPVPRGVAATVLEAMRRPITGVNGTMKALRGPALAAGLTVAGKSGTARVSRATSTSGLTYWAVVVVDGRYVLTVQVRDSEGSGNAATSAAAHILPAFKKLPADPKC